jgi:hypothetical protein
VVPTGEAQTVSSVNQALEATGSRCHPVEATDSRRPRPAVVGLAVATVVEWGRSIAPEYLRAPLATWAERARWEAARVGSEPNWGPREAVASGPGPGLRARRPLPHFTDLDARFPGVRSATDRCPDRSMRPDQRTGSETTPNRS